MTYEFANISNDGLKKIAQFENELKEMLGTDIVLVAYQKNNNDR